MTEPTIECYDVLIIGAGINGAGVFRDLCEQGVNCLIVDKGDYGSGTSAAPSRLIHGGLKYLETGEMRLVAESTYERNLLLKNASHLVTPLPTLIPIYSWTKGIWAAIRTLCRSKTAPRSRGALLVKIGLWFYDFYGSRSRQMPRHRMVGRARARASLPALSTDIVAAGLYYDAAISAPERLVRELVQDGVAANKASRGMNWMQIDCHRSGLIDLTGPDCTKMTVQPKIVVNATGPWIDHVNAVLGEQTNLIGGTKGSHILLDHPDLLDQLDGRMIYFESNDGRILLVFPYLGRALVGSTDIPDDKPDSAACTEDETAYFLRSLAELLPGLTFHKDQIVSSYAGIRPLPNSDGIAPGLISRDHSAPLISAQENRPFPVISLVGGKWTTFRAFAADVTDAVLSELGYERTCSTDTLPIGGGRDMPRSEGDVVVWMQTILKQTGAGAERVATLLARYGTTASQIAAHEGPDPSYIAPTTFSKAEIDWIVRHEQVVHLEDIVLRRTQIAITGQATCDVLRQICKIAGDVLEWDADQRETECQKTMKVLTERHGYPGKD